MFHIRQILSEKYQIGGRFYAYACRLVGILWLFIEKTIINRMLFTVFVLPLHKKSKAVQLFQSKINTKSS
jgi:hypothetical protein